MSLLRASFQTVSPFALPRQMGRWAQVTLVAGLLAACSGLMVSMQEIRDMLWWNLTVCIS